MILTVNSKYAFVIVRVIKQEVFMNNCALIIGIGGQDGTYLTSFLLKKGYSVHGIVKEKPKSKYNNIIQNCLKLKKIKIHKINILEEKALKKTILKIQPSEIYYLATTHEVALKQENFNEVMSVNVNGLFNILEIVRCEMPSSKVFYASSSNVFAGSKESPQNENTIKNPKTLYGIAKLTAMNLIHLYRENYNIYVCYGILYNHESTLRKKIFVSMKIVDAVVNIKLGNQKKLLLGNINDQRDWGFAEDYIKAMWMMLQSFQAKDYVIGTGESLTVKDLLFYAFDYVGLKWKDYVEIDNSFIREKNTIPLIADTSKIKRELKWSPSINFKLVVQKMIDENLKKHINIK